MVTKAELVISSKSGVEYLKGNESLIGSRSFEIEIDSNWEQKADYFKIKKIFQESPIIQKFFAIKFLIALKY
jgi:hypothetical protein